MVVVYAFMISLWINYFIAKWTQRQNEMKITWDLHHFKKESVIRRDFHGDYIVDKISEKIVKKDFLAKWIKALIYDLSVVIGMGMILGLFTIYILI